MDAISAQVIRRLPEMRYGDAHTLFWSFEKGFDFPTLWTTFEEVVSGGMVTDILDYAVLLASCELGRRAGLELHLWDWISQKTPLRRDTQEIVAGSTGVGLKDKDIAWVEKSCPQFAGANVSRHGGHAQHKLAMLVQHVEAVLVRGEQTGAALQEACVEFSGKKYNYWLKVAADQKAEVIDDILHAAPESRHRIRLELGAYVGFSGLRLAGVQQAQPPAGFAAWRVMSLEVDPLHVCIARHMLNLGERAGLAEVRTGQVRDLIPRISDELGESSLGLVFMDHRGTRFHEEVYLFERHRMPTSQMEIIADNVLHPGAPVFLWEETRPNSDRSATVWSVPEFGGESCIEDWMAVERYEPRQVLRARTAGGVNRQSILRRGWLAIPPLGLAPDSSPDPRKRE